MPTIPCNECRGSGVIIINSEKTCGQCLGSGRNSKGDPCSTCDGKGYVKTRSIETCRNCYGSGKLSI